MNVSLFQAAAAMNANARWQEIIAGNMSASYIPGFKKQDLSFGAIHAGYLAGAKGPLPTAPQPLLLPTAQAETNFQPGELTPTGISTDLAIQGSGFFQVKLPDGSLAYTRNGQFQLNTQDQLCTQQGYLVMADGGPVQLDPNNHGALTISPTGKISQGAALKGTLKVMDFANPEGLTSLGNGFFAATNPNMVPQPATKSTVQQGFLEAANTSAVVEMSDLITALRSYEANQKVIQDQDHRLGEVISGLGNPS